MHAECRADYAARRRPFSSLRYNFSMLFLFGTPLVNFSRYAFESFGERLLFLTIHDIPERSPNQAYSGNKQGQNHAR